GLDPINAWGENTSTFSEAILSFASNLCEPRIPVSLERGVSSCITYGIAGQQIPYTSAEGLENMRLLYQELQYH
ncbi:MAG: hypothetical protein RLZZ580_150, partial [Cyanobacteriota bacterium]